MQGNRKQTTIDEFEILSKLGQGGFGTVYKVKRKENGQIYAMKKIKMMQLSSKEKENALNEIRILASIDNEFIVKYKDAFYHSPTSELCIVMEYADKGDLQGKINDQKKLKKLFDEDLVWEYTAQMLQGIKTLHDLNILHRDLKGANVFLGKEGKIVKLGDLNVSKVQKSNFAFTQTGTPYYLAPEVWKGEPYNGKCDVWSVGCVIYEMVTLEPPFKGRSMEELYKKVIHGSYSKISSQYSKELAKFIDSCLIKNPKTRVSIEQLLQIPQISQRIKVDLQKQQKAQLLKTMKLPYGGLANLKNILPGAKYEDQQNQLNEQIQKEIRKTVQEEEQKQQQQYKQNRPNNLPKPSYGMPQKQEIQTPVVQVSKKNDSQYNNYHNNQNQNRPGSANGNQFRIRSQSQDKLNKNNQNGNQYGYGYGYQQPNYYNNQDRNSRQGSRQNSQNRFEKPQPQNNNVAKPFSQRCASQEKLQQRYNQIAQNGYNIGQGGYGYKQQQQSVQGSYNKPPSGQQGKPPSGNRYGAVNKPPVYQTPNYGQTPQFFGRRKSQLQ